MSEPYLECAVEGCYREAKSPVILYSVTGWMIKVYTCEEHDNIDELERADPDEP